MSPYGTKGVEREMLHLTRMGDALAQSSLVLARESVRPAIEHPCLRARPVTRPALQFCPGCRPVETCLYTLPVLLSETGQPERPKLLVHNFPKSTTFAEKLQLQTLLRKGVLKGGQSGIAGTRKAHQQMVLSTPCVLGFWLVYVYRSCVRKQLWGRLLSSCEACCIDRLCLRVENESTLQINLYIEGRIILVIPSEISTQPAHLKFN